ncbi:MAG: CYTH domain-containing protein [Bacteroidales bacterium]|nr:CYTH domain-containing protein [Bacteroides sp.]MCM1198068.1 CYTH domain-containing protein [Clostridium sp.]MCM1502468.1 CYTH domain-containing protein [Bacteroidales bacterium]
MGKETERKFLVRGDYKDKAHKATRIVQGYLSSVPERTVRVRTKGGHGFITVKGAGSRSGASRFEWEKEIPAEEAEELLELCEKGTIDKTRHLVNYMGHTFEVDEFHGDNVGLTIAEIELSCEDEPFGRPDWLGEEVTGDIRYYNSYLSSHPYCTWPDSSPGTGNTEA